MSCSGLRTIRRYSSRRRKDSRWRAQPGHRRSTSRGIRSASPSVKWSDVHSLSTNTRGEGFRRHDLVAVLVQLLHLEVLSFDDPGSSAVGRAFRPCRARSTWMAVPICCENRVGTLAEGRRGYRPLGRDDPERRLGTSTRSGSGSTIDPYSPGAPTSTGSSSKAPKTRQSRISPAKSFGMVRLFGRTSRDTT
jgi:hypothetical protein